MTFRYKGERYQSNILARLLWYCGIGKSVGTPLQMFPPHWFTPLDGWISDPEEIIRAIRADDEMGIRPSVK